VRLAHAAGAEQEDVLPLVQEAQRRELLDGGLRHLGLRGEVEARYRLERGEPGQLAIGLDAALEARGELQGEELVEDFDGELLLLLGTLEDRVEIAERGVEFQSGELVPDALVAHGGAHAATPATPATPATTAIPASL